MPARTAGLRRRTPVRGEEDDMVEAEPPAGNVAAPMAADVLFAQVYDRLKAMAGRRLAARPHDTLDTTALVHELYLRVGRNDGLHFERPEQFFGYAARAMRHLLADRARDRLRLRAGGDWERVTLTGSDWRLALDSAEQALDLDDALGKLEQADERAARVTELICFAGLGQEQVADLLGLGLRTIARDWRFARAFLKAELG